MPLFHQQHRKGIGIGNVTATNDSPNILKQDTIVVPRWVVYFQAAMLGVVATTFFIFGILVGTVNSGPKGESVNELDLRISGNVLRTFDNQETPDSGSVVLLLPESPSEISRQNPVAIRPHSFEPLENPSIEWIRGQGGSVVRTNVNGDFELFAKPGEYNLLIISKGTRKKPGQKLTKEQVAAISQYFLPVEKLIEDQQFHWRHILLKNQSINVKKIRFD